MKVITFNRKRRNAGIVTAAAAVLAGFLLGEDVRTGIAALLFAPLIIFVWGLRFSVSGERGSVRVRRIAGLFLFLLSIFGIYACTQLIVNVGHILYIGHVKILLEMALVLLLVLPLFAVTGRMRLSLTAASAVFCFISLVSYFVFRFRGTELMPLDILSVKTAMGVSGEYSFRVEPMTYCGILLWIVLVGFWYAFPPEGKGARAWLRLAALALCPVLIAAWYAAGSGIYIETWGNNGSKYNGYLLNFSLQLRSEMEIKPPEGYSEEAVRRLEEKYGGSGETPSGGGQQPDIILILEESFADLSMLGSPVRTEQPVTPYWDSLEENVTRGYVLSSVYGGGTANSEFEVLTGNTMGFLPYGATPYQLYIHEPSASMASWLKDQGYVCKATHPYLSGGWSRTKVYPLLGFDSWSFIDDYPQQDMIRDYVSDREMFGEVIRIWEERDEDQPLFLFGITMQNHGGFGYDGEGYTPCMKLEGYSEEYPDAEQYLGLIHESDSAIEDLLSYFEQQDRDVIVAIFGDHYPGLNIRFYEEIHQGPFDTLDEQEPEYAVPYVIWTNFDRESGDTGLISMSDLGLRVLQTAGIELAPYDRFRLDLEQVIPVWNSQGFYSKTAGGFIPYREAEGEEKEWLQTYRIWQYNYLFDSGGRSDILFPE